MNNVEVKVSKILIIVSVVLCIFLSVFYAYQFVICVKDYYDYDVTHDDLQHSELTFLRYEQDKISSDSFRWVVYFAEHDTPFEIGTRSDDALDTTALAELASNCKVSVYYRPSSLKNHDYEICEISHNTTMLLRLEDFVLANQRNQSSGAIAFAVMFVLTVAVIVFLCKLLSKLNRKAKPQNEYNAQYGELKIEHIAFGNVIQVFNAPEVCSLVINGHVADQFWGVIGGNFALQGTVQVEDRQVMVQAKMDLVNMRLYFDGELVATKFMALG